jgi:hypothetical protein
MPRVCVLAVRQRLHHALDAVGQLLRSVVSLVYPAFVQSQCALSPREPPVTHDRLLT